MGKGLAAVEVVGGIILWLIGIAIIIGMYAANTIMLVAAPMLIFSMILFVIGTILFWRASLNLKETSRTTLAG
jgi:membrane protein implicated in regulation of membrane protease activity